jgi:hypothetical protein
MTEYSVVQRRQIARWRKAIINSWQKQVHAIVATGRLLIRAHDDLIDVHGAWSRMVTNDLPFGSATTKKLMAIARHPMLRSGSHENRLPASWTTLHELSHVHTVVLTRLIDSGVVNSRTQRDEAEQMRWFDPQSSSFKLVTPNYDEIESVVYMLRYALAKFLDAVNDRLLSTIREHSARMNELCIDVERRVRTIEARRQLQPMLEGNDAR